MFYGGCNRSDGTPEKIHLSLAATTPPENMTVFLKITTDFSEC